MGLSKVDLFVFNIFDIRKHRYFNYLEFVDFCITNELNTVPIEEVCIFNYTLKSLLERSKGKYKLSGKPKEGIVVRTIMGDDRISFKVLNSDALLKNKE